MHLDLEGDEPRTPSGPKICTLQSTSLLFGVEVTQIFRVPDPGMPGEIGE